MRQSGKVLVRVAVIRSEYEWRDDDEDGEDYYLLKAEVVSEREWWEDRTRDEVPRA